MSYNPSTPISGSSQTGLTSPTFTLVADVAPDAANGKQHVVSALGGTQTGVNPHSISDPFTLTFSRPARPVTLNASALSTSVLPKQPMNKYQCLTRKGVAVMANQPRQVVVIRTTIEIPAGADVADPTSIRSALSAHIGLLSQQSTGIGDTAINNVL